MAKRNSVQPMTTQNYQSSGKKMDFMGVTKFTDMTMSTPISTLDEQT